MNIKMKYNKKISKRGFIADVIPNMIALVVIIFLIIFFHFIFAIINKTNNNLVSYDNEPILTAESVLYSFLDAEIQYKGIECFGHDKNKLYNYSIKEILYADYNCNNIDPKIPRVLQFNDAYANDDNRNVDIQIKSYFYDKGSQKYTTESPLFSAPKRACEGKPNFNSNAYVFLPVKGGLLKVEANIKEYSDTENCLR